MKKLNEAGKAVHQSNAVLDQAVRNEQAMRNALYKAQDAFRKNMADENATEALSTAIEQLQKATAARAQAQRALSLNQQTMSDARQRLAAAQKQALAKVDEQAKQEVDGIRLGLDENNDKQTETAEGQEGEQGNGMAGEIQPGNVSNESGPLAQTDGSSIIKDDRKQLESGAATLSQDEGNRPFRALAASGAATDVGYANGNQYVKVSNEESAIKEPNANDLLTAVMTPEQIGYLSETNQEALGLFTDEQRQRILAGENLSDIFDELDSGKQGQIEQLSQKVLKSLHPSKRTICCF